MYQFLLIQYNRNIYRSPWLCEILNCGLTNICDSGLRDFSVKWLTPHVKRSLQDQFIQRWHAGINQKEIRILYRSFKTNFPFEKYLIALPNYLSITLRKF